MAIPQFQLLLISVLLGAAAAGNFYQDFDIVWGNDHANIQENGGLLTLSLDQTSGSAFQSRSQYLFGKIDMQLKLVPGNSAGTVTAYYMSSKGETWDEIDFEFLGNVTGEPYILHTNVFCQGKGGREMQFYLWFDPTTDFHNYTILWTPQRIVFYVDGIPIREYKNLESNGIPYPNSQAMRVYSTLWNADNWATRGGLVKTDWTQAPFVATYRNFKADACVMSWGQSYCSQDSDTWMSELIDYAKQGQMQWVHDNYLVYNYCTDYKRFAADGLPPECSYSLDN